MGLDAAVRELATARNFAAFTTMLPDGRAQTQVMWVDADDEHVLINTEVHRAKFRNVSRDPRVTVMIWDSDDPYRYAEVRGTVVDTVRGPEARAHIDACSERYFGRPYREESIRSERVIVRVRPDRVITRGL